MICSTFNRTLALAAILVVSSAATSSQAFAAEPALATARSGKLQPCATSDLPPESADAVAEACARALEQPGLAPDEARKARLVLIELRLDQHRLKDAGAEIDRLLSADPHDPRALVARANLHLMRHELDAQFADLTAALQADPHSADALEQRAIYYGAKNDRPRALADFDAAAAAHPSGVRVAIERAMFISRGGDEEQALKALGSLEGRIDKAPALRLLGAAYESLKQPKKALKAYDQAIKAAPQDAANVAAKASLLNDQGRSKEALALCDAALALRPKFGMMLRLKAEILIDAQDYAGAAKAAAAAAEAYSGDVMARVLLARADRQLDKPQEALTVVQEVLDRDPYEYNALFSRAQTYGALKRTDEAIAAYSQLIARGDEAAAYFNRGQLYAAEEDHAKAAEDFAVAAKLDPTDVDAPLQLAAEQSALKQPQAEIASYRIALQRDPTNITAMVDLAISYSDLDDCKQSVEWYERAVKLQPRRAALHRGLAWCYRQLGQDARADDHADTALRLDPASAWTWKFKGDHLTDKGRTAQALESYGRGLKVAPKDVDLLIARGKLYERIKDPVHASADFDAAVTAEPKNVDALNARGLYRWRRDDNDLALADFEAMVALGSDGDIGYYNASLAWRDKGREDQALRQLSRYLKLHPDDTDALLEKATIYQDLEDYLLAIEYFDAVIRINPKLPDAWSGRAAVKKILGDPGAEADSLKAKQLGKTA